MTETRVERTETANPVIVERKGSGAGTIIAVIIGLALVALVAYFLMNMNRQEEVRTDAVSDAAASVAGAAESVGDAAGRAADNVAPAAPAE
jgi:flagellar basal body-associated protein FliL